MPPAVAGLAIAYLQAAAGHGAVWRVPGVPGGADDAVGLRAADARLRELLAERDGPIAERDERIAGQGAEIAGLREQLAVAGCGPGREGEAELAELLEAAVASR